MGRDFVVTYSSIFKNNLLYLFIFGSAGSSRLCGLPLVEAASRGHSQVWACGHLIFFKFYLFLHSRLCWSSLACGLLSRLGHRLPPAVASLPPELGPCRASADGGAEGLLLCGVFPGQRSSPCPPRWRADSHPGDHWRHPGLLSRWLLRVWSAGSQ